MEIGSIILSGGSSKRMGTPKAFLKIRNKTFLEIIYENHLMSGVKEPVIVIPDFLEDECQILSLNEAKIVVCNPPEKNTLGSLKKGLDVLKDNRENFIYHPVDFPLVKVSTLKKLLATSKKSKKEIIKPVFKSRGGHPIVLSSTLIREIFDASEELGLREVVRKDQERIENVVTDDKGVIQNINTLDDFKEIIY